MKKKRRKKRSFSQFTHTDRDRMEALLAKGHTQKEVAEIIGKSESAVSRERKRKKKRARTYRATIAHQKARARRRGSKYCGMAVESDPVRKRYIIEQLEQHRSPDEIAGRIRKEKVYAALGKDAIYAWLYSPRGEAYAHHLCTRRKRRKPQKRATKRELIPNRISLTHRPTRGVHAQGDTFVSRKEDGTAGCALVVIPDAQLILGGKVASMSPTNVTPVFSRLLRSVTVHDVTFDNGIENRHHEQLPVPAYFCEPHHPWEKPDVENSIGLMRRWFLPKGTNMQTVSEDALQLCIHTLNDKYRKSLGYANAYEVARARGIINASFVKKRRVLAATYRKNGVAFGVRI